MLTRQFWFLLLMFALGRVGFMLYNAELWPASADASVTGFGAGLPAVLDMGRAIFYGLIGQDLIVTATLLVIPALVARFGVQRLRLWLSAYYVVVGIAVGLIVVADAIMYEFWQFKLSGVVLAYAAYPEGTANSVSPAFIATRVGCAVVYMAALAAGCICLTPRRAPERLIPNRQAWKGAGIVAFAFALIFPQVTVGTSYHSDRLFLNHAAVNPIYGFAASLSMRPYDQRHNAFTEDRRAQLMEGLYAPTDTPPADTLLRTARPDILIVFAESFGSEFVQRLGGLPGTDVRTGQPAPVDASLERLIPEGIFWTNYYSSSFRTDRGTVSAYCGHPAYTDVGLMTHRETHANLPSLPRSLTRAGYTSAYLYPGPMTNMGKGDFLAAIGFDRLLDHTAFSPDELDGPWGANDLTSARKAAAIMSGEGWSAAAAGSPSAPSATHTPSSPVISPSPSASVAGAAAVPGASAPVSPRLLCYQTVSSHEPWQVPYERLTDPVQNAFAYTDAAIGEMIDSLRRSPVWDNLLVIILPDHGHLYKVRGGSGVRRQAFDDPEFFHAPMLWLGGAIREPRTLDVLMSQTDLCATLLGQLGLPHTDYPWSRDVLSPDYRQPFVYAAFPAGILYRDVTGTTIYDVTADRPIYSADARTPATVAPATVPGASAQVPSALRAARAQAILQTTYDQLPALHAAR